MQNFEHLGREVDRATAAATNAAVYIKGHKDPQEFADKISLSITSANWADGSMDLQAALREVLRDHLPEMVHEAMVKLERRAETTRAQLQKVFSGEVPAEDPKQSEAPQGTKGGNQTRNAAAR